MSTDFLLGAATAAHQVEGNNIHSDYWALEQMSPSDFKEPSLDAVDHYNRYEEDIRLLAEAGLNAFRFSIEWARIEPEKGNYDDEEIEHYRQVLLCCKKYGVTPIVTLHHFSSPKWLISKGGWESKAVVNYFEKYCRYVVSRLGELMEYVCTINEANMGLQIAAVAKDMMRAMGITPQVGMNFELPEAMKKIRDRQAELFGMDKGTTVNTFLSMRTPEGDRIIMEAHQAARKAIREVCPDIKIGITLSLFDLQAQPGGEKMAAQMWEEDFGHYLPYLQEDDFLGLQNYTRKLVGKEGGLPVPEGAETTQMGYEFYPEALGNVIRKVAREFSRPILVTENGIATADDQRRIAYIRGALQGIAACREEGISVIGYMHWSLLDNFEWQAGYDKTFGLIAVDRKTQKRYPKESLKVLGSMLSNI